MRKAFEEAADLFRHCGALRIEGATEPERAEFYHGMALLAEGLNKLEKRLQQFESEAEKYRIFKDRRSVGKRIIVATSAHNVP
jgi:hypothetical protein